MKDSEEMQKYYDQLELIIDIALEVLSTKNLSNHKEIEYMIYTGSHRQIQQIITFLSMSSVPNKPKKTKKIKKKEIIEV